jgi:glycosyltransferase involved in cell wall biosynthesis
MAKVPLEFSLSIKVNVIDLMCYTPEYDRRFVEALTQINPSTILTAIDFPLDPEVLKGARLQRDTTIRDHVNRLRLPKPIKSPLKGIEYLVNLRRMARRLKRDGTQVVHMQWSPYAHVFAFDHRFLEHLRLQGIKTVHTVHNVYPHDSGRRQQARYRRLYQIPDALICHTQDAKRRLVEEQGQEENRIWVIPHGPLGEDEALPSRAESRRDLGLQDEEIVVLLFGNLRPYKGAEELITAWKKVHKAEPRARLVIAGGAIDDYPQKIRSKTEEAALSDSVLLDLGWIDQAKMLAYHAASDILAYPYRDITQSGALVAGMRHGAPIIATRLPGFEEILEDAKTGRLVPPQDTSALAEALIGLIQDPEARKRQGKEVRRRWEQKIKKEASWDQVARMTLECYQSLL